MDRELYKLSLFLTNLVSKDVKDVRDFIKAYQIERWRNQSPSKRQIMANNKQEREALHKSKHVDEIKNENLSPIRTNTKAERYSGTPHRMNIHTSNLKVAPQFSLNNIRGPQLINSEQFITPKKKSTTVMNFSSDQKVPVANSKVL
jgi:hypothetical protein